MKVPRVTQNTRIWCATGVTRRGHIRVDCCTRKKKQLNANVTELAEGDENKCDVLSVTNRSVGNKDKIDNQCDAPIRRVRGRHYDVYTQVGNTLTYIR